ncbi:MAG: DNA replication/repair protein RecF [Chlamydiia bacterium]
MTLRSLQLLDTRNYTHAHVEFGEGLHAFIGRNAQGKTNLLEALAVCLTGASFRSHHLQDLIREQAERAWIELHYTQASIEQTTRILIEPVQKSAWLNQTKAASLQQLLGILPCVVVQPQDLDLVRGDPQTRRHFMDLLLTQSDPLYGHHLARYRRSLKQRNHLLKMRQLETCEIWEAEMGRSGEYLIQHRLQLLEQIQQATAQLLVQMTGCQESFTCTLRSCVSTSENIQEALRSAWKRQRLREMEIGQTLTGPHREDFTLFLQGREARSYASEGQARSIAAALRLAEWGLLKERSGKAPILCVDDIGLSLDAERCRRLWSLLRDIPQVICTAPHLEAIDPALRPDRIYWVDGGTVQASEHTQ